MALKKTLVAMLGCIVLIGPNAPSAEPVAVRNVEGLVHGFLSLRSPTGTVLASGDLVQLAHGDRVSARLTFRFKDGSLHDETAVFSQRGHFRLITDHLVQKGRTFEQPIEMSIDRASGQVTVVYRNDHGEAKTESKRLDLPEDLANGMIITLLKNVRSDALPTSVSLVAATPAPRLVKVKIEAAGAEPFSVAGSPRKATHYVLKVDIGGLAGVIAPLVGKQPPDSHVWILEGEAPAFVKSEAPLYLGGASWRTELVSPVWPRAR